MKIILALTTMLALSGCASGFWENGRVAPNDNKNSNSEFVFVGCYIVENNPLPNGSVAYGPFGSKTPIMFFQQKNSDGTLPHVNRKNCSLKQILQHTLGN